MRRALSTRTILPPSRRGAKDFKVVCPSDGKRQSRGLKEPYTRKSVTPLQLTTYVEELDEAGLVDMHEVISTRRGAKDLRIVCQHNTSP